ncbi:hypothetical protein HLB23_16580 [Nocardia uniformis]|uniref:Uncharacterized protein n=1 Tax=Nocardia uniformis TaxID=53432 RepID=A0A849C9D1_9NOCA|nr:hypothetical protein [Nocardia uniformis]NNH71459.1 hypothetical protein [Nocardia uniformis]
MRDEDKKWLDGITPEEKAAWVRQDNLIYGGLIAIGTVIVQPFLTAPSMDLTAMIAVVAFAIALPHLGVLVLISDWPNPEGYPILRFLPATAKALGLSFSMIGVGAAFWHISWIAGVAVVASGFGASIALGSYQTRVMVPEQTRREVERIKQEAQREAERKYRGGGKATGTGHHARDDAGEESGL